MLRSIVQFRVSSGRDGGDIDSRQLKIALSSLHSLGSD